MGILAILKDLYIGVVVVAVVYFIAYRVYVWKKGRGKDESES